MLSHQPQGGFITRKPTADISVASDEFRDDDFFGFFFQRNPDPRAGNPRRRVDPYFRHQPPGWR